LLSAVISIVTGLIDVALGLAADVTDTGPVGGIVSLALLVPSLAVTVRRLHDLDRTGFWLLVPLGAALPLIAGGVTDSDVLTMVGGVALVLSMVVLLVFMVMPGTRGPNRFGDDPYGENMSEVFA
jgi:uncharacterized membrane protein YhaH (DUF805 family)